jgi:cellulose 1,4-beta-cellobiosidase
VIATGGAGNSAPSSQVSVSLPAPPAGPTGLAATPGTGQVVLTWNAVAGASNYNISRATASGGPYSVIKYNQNGASYTNTGLAAGTTYYYKVCYTVGGVGASSYSGPASATPN